MNGKCVRCFEEDKFESFIICKHCIELINKKYYMWMVGASWKEDVVDMNVVYKFILHNKFDNVGVYNL